MNLPERMHPLVRRTALEAMRGLTPAFLEALAGELIALEGESLRDAVRELIFLGTVLEEAGHAETAAPLFSLVESKVVIAALDRANATRLAISGESLVMCAKKFARFSGGVWPQEEAEEGERIRLSDLGAARFAGLRLR